MDSGEKSKNDIMQRIQKVRGYIPDEWVFAAERDPEFWDLYNPLYEKVLSDGKALPAKTRELIAIGILAYRHMEQGVYNHAKRALRLGATKQELLEAVETLIIPGGVPAVITGLRGLMMVDEEEKNNAAP